MHWLTLVWWKYLLAQKDRDISWYRVIKCRLRGHPCGVIWYAGYDAMEPNMHCINCGDDLG